MNFFEFQEKLKRPTTPPALAPAPAVAKRDPAANALTVSGLTSQIDRVLKTHLPASVSVRGEVSNYKQHGASGHAYFTLKDDAACINCVMWKSDAIRVKFKPADGMELLASGRVAVYPQQGKYQLYVTQLQPLGQGALELAFQQLRAKLEAEGLFAPGRKKPLPPYPARIALVTSLQTAALQDMLKVLRRYPWVRLFIYHVPVQGDGAGARIAAALDHLNARHIQAFGAAGGIDLILLGRGGGSLEDLWAFNEESVARAVAASGIPIITGVGHEVDVSIADLAADHHAHTPTEAAQVAMQSWRTARDQLAADGVRLRRGLRTIVQEARQRFNAVEKHEVFRRPLDRINGLRQLLDDRQRALSLAIGDRLRILHRRLANAAARLDDHRPAAVLARLRERLGNAQMSLAQTMTHRLARIRERVGKAQMSLAQMMTHRLARSHQRLFALASGLRERHPRHLIVLHAQRLKNLESLLRRTMLESDRRRTARLDSLEARLNALNPQRVLERGYSITTVKKSGALVRKAAQLAPGARVVTRFADGTVESVVEDSKQMSLFE